MNAILFQPFRRLDPLPGRSNLDQHPLLANARLLVKANQLVGLFNRGFGVVTEAGIHLRGDPARHDLENLLAKGDADFIKGFHYHILRRRLTTDDLARFPQRTVNQFVVGRDLGRSQNEGGIGGGIPGSELADRVNFAGVGHHDRHGGQLIKQMGHGKEAVQNH